MKKFLALAMVMIMTLMAVACGTTTTTTTAPTSTTATTATTATNATTTTTSKELPTIKIGFSFHEVSEVGEITKRYLNAAVEDAKKAGFKIEIVTKEVAEINAEAQIQAIENLLSSGIDVLLVSVTIFDAVKPTLKKCNEMNVPIIVMNQLEEFGSDVTINAFIGYSHQVAGALCAYEMLDAMGGPGLLGEGKKVDASPDQALNLAWWESVYKDFDWNSVKGDIAIVAGIAGHRLADFRLDGFREVMKKAPNIKEVSCLYSDFQRVKAIAATENILQSNPEVVGIYGCSAEIGIGISIACESAGRKDIAITCMDGTGSSVEAVLKGRITSDTWLGFPEWGWFGAMASVRAALGLKNEHMIDINTRSIIQSNTTNFYPNTLLPALDWKGTMDEALAAAN